MKRLLAKLSRILRRGTRRRGHKSADALRPLVIIGGRGPAQASIAETVGESWGDQAVTVWLEHESSVGLSEVAHNGKASYIIAVGVDAVLAAAGSGLELPMDGVFVHDELDFRFSNEYRQRQLLRAFAACERLWFDSTVAMDKACAHGSDRPHLLLPLASTTAGTSATSNVADVVIVTSAETLARAEEQTVLALNEALQQRGTDSRVVAAEQLFTQADLDDKRMLRAALSGRGIGENSVVVLTGKSGHHAFVATALSGHNAVLMDATVENASLAKRLGFPTRALARGAALVERTLSALDSESSILSTHQDVATPAEFQEAFERAIASSLPAWHEEGMAELGQVAFDLFFSTAAIENRSDGARPQRIRAMSQAFGDSDAPVIRMTSNLNLLERRLRAALALVDQGAHPRFGYGENSTAPMLDAALEALERGLLQLKSAGLAFAWFVRDLHWLDPSSSVSQTSDALDFLQQRGVHELNTMVRLADAMFAPSAPAAEHFDRLLLTLRDSRVEWLTLPPGIDQANTLELSATRSTAADEIRLVYAGGLGGVYDLSMLVQALHGLNRPWHLQCTVREEDSQRAHDLLAGFPEERVSITVDDFSFVGSEANKTAGLALLDSAYGAASFPLKVMNYVEKRMSVVVYQDSSPAPLVERYGVGVIAERSVAGVRDALASLPRTVDAMAWDQVQESESWAARAASVRQTLASLSDGRMGGVSQSSKQS